MSWELIAGLAGTFLALVFGLLARWERRKGNEDRALLGAAHEEMVQMEQQITRQMEALPTDSDLRTRLVRLRDRQNRMRDTAPKRSSD